jgi:hypothetical protein
MTSKLRREDTVPSARQERKNKPQNTTTADKTKYKTHVLPDTVPTFKFS